MFETFFVNAVSEAMVKAKETAIINGTGSGQPKGILRETPAKTVALAGDTFTYSQLLELEGAQEKDGAVWSMTRQTYFSKVLGMVDEQGHPIARVNAGIDGRPEYTIFGRRVLFLNPDYLAGSNVVAFMFEYSDYIWNSGVPMTTKRYFDEDVDDTVVKAIEICDGKVVETQSLITVTAG
jgi:HK97 family phage major capsid protein